MKINYSSDKTSSKRFAELPLFTMFQYKDKGKMVDGVFIKLNDCHDRNNTLDLKSYKLTHFSRNVVDLFIVDEITINSISSFQ